MPNQRKRKNWDAENMIAAIKACRSKTMGYKKSAKTHGVPQTTLERLVKMNGPPEVVVQTKLGKKPVFSPEMEDHLSTHCLQMEQKYFGITKKDICRMAFALCKENKIKNPFNNIKECAGSKWFKCFLRRHPELSVRTPQGISYARIKSFTPDNVSKFFDLYEPEMDKIRHNPSRIYNCDESGISVVQHKHIKVIARKGKKQIGAITSAERGSTITVVFCFNAIGQYVPPLIIFPRKNMKIELMNGAPPSSIYACHQSGWIQQEIFVQWLHHFIEFTKPTEEDPVILILDGHYSHTKNLEVVNVARAHHVVIICLPPHSTHKMQPLDVAFMSPFKTYYAQEISQWLKQHPGRVVTVYQVAELFGMAYNRAATAETAVNGFRKTGMFPVNRNIFRDYDFADNSLHENINENIGDSIANDVDIGNAGDTVNDGAMKGIPKDDSITSISTANTSDGVLSARSKLVADHAMPCTSKCNSEEMLHITPPKTLTEKLILPSNILPIPNLSSKIDEQKKTRGGKCVVVTSTPYKEELEESKKK